MNPDEQVIKLIVNLILVHYSSFFPSAYPDIPLNMSMIQDVAAKALIDISGFKEEELLKLAEIQLARTAPLNWNNYGSLALILNELYPDEDLVKLGEQAAIDYVRKLPNFADSKVPDHELVDALIYTWMSLGDDEDTDFSLDTWS